MTTGAQRGFQLVGVFVPPVAAVVVVIRSDLDPLRAFLAFAVAFLVVVVALPVIERILRRSVAELLGLGVREPKRPDIRVETTVLSVVLMIGTVAFAAWVLSPMAFVVLAGALVGMLPDSVRERRRAARTRTEASAP